MVRSRVMVVLALMGLAYAAHAAATEQEVPLQQQSGIVDSIADDGMSFVIKIEDADGKMVKQRYTITDVTVFMLNGQPSTKELVLKPEASIDVVHRAEVAVRVEAQTE